MIRLVWLYTHWWYHLPTEKKEAEVTGLGINCFFQQQFGLCGKLHSYRYLCKDELVIMCALGPLSMSPLEDVVPCLRGAAPYVFSSADSYCWASSLEYISETCHASLVLSLIKDSVLFFHRFYFLPFCTVFIFNFFPPPLILPSSSYQLSVNSFSLCSNGRITGPSASRYQMGVITVSKQFRLLIHFLRSNLMYLFF